MSSKEAILQLLDKELLKLVSPYEANIKRLTDENQNLKLEVNRLEKNKEELEFSLSQEKKKQIDEISNQNLLSHLTLLSEAVSYEIIDELFLLSAEKHSLLLLLHLRSFIHLKQVDKVEYIFNLLQHNPKTLLYEVERSMPVIKDIFDMVFLHKNIDDFSEEILESLLSLSAGLSGTSLDSFVKNYLSSCYLSISERILTYNEANITKLFLRLLLEYNLETELKTVLTIIIEEEWDFFDFNVTKDEFTFFLWFTYLFGLDTQLLDKSDGSLRFLSYSSRELELYNYIYECMNRKSTSNREKLESLLIQFKHSSLFNEKEASLIIKKLKKVLQPYLDIKHNSLRQKYQKFHGLLYVVDNIEINSLLDIYQHTKKKVMLPLYDDQSSPTPVFFKEAEIYMPKRSRFAFITKSSLDTLESQYSPYILKINVSFMKTKPDDSYSVTSTIKKDEQKKEEDLFLNDNSALKRMGYQITGLTRDKRWHILEQAVPKLGLNRVVSIISYNVKLRKTQKNGVQKYSYALSEWDYDLNRLKKMYYKHDFNWPDI